MFTSGGSHCLVLDMGDLTLFFSLPSLETLNPG